MQLVDNLKWRYATKKMSGKTIPDDTLNYILEAARLAPSSSGLQPYRVFAIGNRALLEQIKPIAFNQSQITDCSHLLVFAAWDGYSFEQMGNVFAHTATERGMPADAMADYQKTLWGMYEPKGREWHANHAARQAYIAFGLAIAAAAEQKVDATPMEGFDNARLDELLGLDKLGLKSAVILALGYRASEGDWLAGLKKVRTPEAEFVTRID